MLKLTSEPLKSHETDMLLIPVAEDISLYDDSTVNALVEQAKAFKEFKAESKDELILYSVSEIASPRIMFYGIGKAEKMTHETFRSVAGKAVKRAIQKKLETMSILVPTSKPLNMDTSMVLKAMMEGAFLANHVFDKYKKEKKQQPLKAIHFHTHEETCSAWEHQIVEIETVCRGTLTAREWVTIPSNDKKPEQLADAIVNIARTEKLSVSVIDEATLKEKHFGAILAVASGSESKPSMVVLEHHPVAAKKTIVLVGKGVTFDAGGINLKSKAGLEDMKCDMAGAATVASVLLTAARLNLNLHVIGVMPIVENMPSGTSIRPGDVIRTYNGKTVEIGNTDAEGRLILADAMSYAIETYHPDTIIDMATLTGACMVALGEKIAGVFSFDSKLAETIVEAGNLTHERCWKLPLPDDYKELLKSDLADMNNMSSSTYGGAITAALFLSEFVEKTKWAHIDIAGPAFNKKETDYCGAGGTGFGVRLLWNTLQHLIE